jgi:quinol monooxygenase YgiN
MGSEWLSQIDFRTARGNTMIHATITMKVPADKRHEVLQTLRALLGQIRKEAGCIGCKCYVDVESENSITIREEWQTAEALDSHLQSADFGILIGTMKLLDKEPEISFNTVLSTAGTEAVRAARNQAT